MPEICGIIVDLDLCVGCHACEVACKQENNVPIGTKWIRIISIGPEEVNGSQSMDFIPMITDECTLCAHRLNEGLEPRCVDNCPTQALIFCNSADKVLSALQSIKRLQVCTLRGGETAFG